MFCLFIYYLTQFVKPTDMHTPTIFVVISFAHIHPRDHFMPLYTCGFTECLTHGRHLNVTVLAINNYLIQSDKEKKEPDIK